MTTLIKKSNYSNSISLTSKEADNLNAGIYSSLSLNGMTVDISAVGKPTQIPLKDKDGYFKGLSPYFVAKVQMPSEQYRVNININMDINRTILRKPNKD